VRSGDVVRLGDLDWPPWPRRAMTRMRCCCIARRGVLISADALWRNGFGIIFPELDGESGFEEARATLELIRSLDVRTVIPGHGAPFSEVDDALEKAFSRLDYLQADPCAMRTMASRSGEIPAAGTWPDCAGGVAGDDAGDSLAAHHQCPLPADGGCGPGRLVRGATAEGGAAASDGVFLLDR
jgi:hypothetical protein